MVNCSLLLSPSSNSSVCRYLIIKERSESSACAFLISAGEYDSGVLKVSDDFIHFFPQGVEHWSRLLKDRISSLRIDLHLDSLKGAYLFLCWEELYVFKE
uniref:Uncharacterized protein n=1 Tax=Chromera velia CCMP2878 TaxID=1169474 RepID=A0A0G4I042_9ALVE|eukprot:Cvel_34262.t1-p1 / transcript=Cvel_34262.t1 / gene=Cvel_34262 / organism=Chromera_velia_CCMP2878 / gene_product=hypothetical protein / transcript_product=hypothetical protein / location=Cvel_scaffold5814:114-1726(+) / protein_length=99 / sequence_SO=supercontig / SO=protein_coding / is_pseudo=false